MRFTQFGHQVPRRNSRISVPCVSNPLRVNVPSRLAAPREKSGAREPISRVSVRFCMLSSTVSEVECRNNNGWGRGDGLRARRHAEFLWGGPWFSGNRQSSSPLTFKKQRDMLNGKFGERKSAA